MISFQSRIGVSKSARKPEPNSYEIHGVAIPHQMVRTSMAGLISALLSRTFRSGVADLELDEESSR